MANVWFHVSGRIGGNTVDANESNFSGIGGRINFSSNESNSQITDQTGFTVDDGFIRVTANTVSANSTLRFRDDGADVGPNITITASTAGTFTDSTAATFTAGSLINWHLTTGATGTSMTITVVACTLEHATDDLSLIVCGFGSNTRDISTTFYSQLGGRNEVNATESDAQYTMNGTYTFKNMGIDINSNGNTAASTMTLRDDGVDTSLVATITASTNGIFEDTINTVTPVDGSLLNYELTAGTGMHDETLVFRDMYMHQDSASHIAMAGGAAALKSDGTTNFLCLEGGPSSSGTESNAEAQTPIALNIADLNVKVTVNASPAASSVDFRDDNANALSASITSSTTGIFENTGTALVAADSQVNYRLSVGAGGDLTITNIGYELNQPVDDLTYLWVTPNMIGVII